VTREARLKPSGPYSLLLTARRAGDATRRFRDGVLTATLETGNGVERAQAWQLLDGTVCVRAESDEAIEQLRFCLALDDDHSEFLRRFARDPLLRVAMPLLAGLRPLRVATVAHALLRAFCGQLIESHVARRLEWRIVAACSPEHEDLHAPAAARRLGRLSPAELRKLGLHARRGAGLVRLCRGLDLERLRSLPTATVAERLGRERGIGPWSVGLVCLEGLGRYERGLVGDLGLVKLASALRGRYVEAAETAELLEPYGEWAGLATVYLMAAFGRGLIPLPEGAGIRRPPERIRNRAA
jgi:3-methyladenine DNA glycosylase/8-oxoguanine DNA glycosylase